MEQGFIVTTKHRVEVYTPTNASYLFKKLFNAKNLEDKITRELLEDIPVDELCDDILIQTIPGIMINTLKQNNTYMKIEEGTIM